MMNKSRLIGGVCACVLVLITNTTSAATINLNIPGTDAIFLAGLEGVVTIPELTNAVLDVGLLPPAFPLLRHSGGSNPLPGFLLETFPKKVSVSAGNVLNFSNVTGLVHYPNGEAPNIDPAIAPEGDAATASNITGLAGISGYIGSAGALVGVFLSNAVPLSGAPATLDFSTAASRDFLTLSPGIGQVFFIGNGLTSTGNIQDFNAPAGATRFFAGIPDGFGFINGPGAYEDNDGSFQISVSIVPIPATVWLFGSGLLGLVGMARRKKAWHPLQ